MNRLALVACGAVMALTLGAGTEFPDLLTTKDGRAVTSAAVWEQERRAEVAAAILPVEYGTMPKEPVEVRVEQVGSGTAFEAENIATRKLKVWCDMDGREVTFVIQLWFDKTVAKGRKLPVLIDGDACWSVVSERVVRAVVARGWMMAHFNRCEVALDNRSSGDSTLLKWAWTYHRAIDALLKAEPRADASRIAITGHSRGGKTVQLAAATDARIFAVGDNCSGCAGSSPYRDVPQTGETLRAITRVFPYWFAPGWGAWVGKENELPFDQHFLEALVAPRKLFVRHGQTDLWANPPGARKLVEESRKVWALYGKGENVRYSVRAGGHGHTYDDYMAFLDFIEGREVAHRHLVTAHAGAMDTVPNTLESLRKLVKTGVDVVEVDVTFRPSGLPVIVHRESPGEDEGVPLADALAILGASDKMVQLDLKAFQPDRLAQLPPMLRKAGLEKRVFFAGAGLDEFALVKKACPGFQYYLNCKPPERPGPEMDALVEAAVKAGAKWVNPNFKRVTRSFADAVRARGIKLSVWTVGSAEDYEICEALEPDSITVRWVPPTLARSR